MLVTIRSACVVVIPVLAVFAVIAFACAALIPVFEVFELIAEACPLVIPVFDVLAEIALTVALSKFTVAAPLSPPETLILVPPDAHLGPKHLDSRKGPAFQKYLPSSQRGNPFDQPSSPVTNYLAS